MSIKLTKKAILQTCGSYAVQKGERLCRANNVQITSFDSEANEYTAEVTSGDRYEVQLSFDLEGVPHARCTCPSLRSIDTYCHHVAAAMLRLLQLQHIEPQLDSLDTVAATRSDERHDQSLIAERILGLFDDQPVRPIHNRTLTETRTILEMQFVLRLLAMNRRTSLFGIELKVGLKTRYIVRSIASFLDQLSRGEGCPISPKFSYDPELHSFSLEDERVLQALIEMMKDQSAIQDLGPSQAAYARTMVNDRMLLIPPKSWQSLLPHLLQVPHVSIIDGSVQVDGLSLRDDPLPLRFAFEQAPDAGCFLYVRGLEQVTMLEPYRLAIHDGAVHQLDPKESKRLAELKTILDDTGTERIPIPRDQIGSFIAKAVPGLKKLGQVEIDPAISGQVVQNPLLAKLYLDRVKDRLLAAVEFQYGGVTINPLEVERTQLGANHILIRDLDKERQILEIIERQPFTKTESGYYMNDEDAEFHFLYTVLPQLEKLVKVYATTAIKLRVYRLDEMPKVSVHVSRDRTLNWLEFRLNMGWIPETEIRGLIQALEEKRPYYRLPNGSLLPLDHTELRELNEFLEETGLHRAEFTGASLHVPLLHGLPYADHEYSGLKLDRPVRQLLDNLKHPDNLDYPIPEPLTHVLRDYQKTGYHWLKTLAYYGFGGILADDMGLGKTVQSIAFIASVLPEIRQQRTPALVISPGSLIYNWQNELRKFAPDIRVQIADGTPRERTDKIKKQGEVDVIITSYPLLLRDVKHYAGRSFHTLILDEAQTFKNHTTQTARAVKKLQAAYRFALTGTPMENRLEELWSIFHVVFPALFQDLKAFANLPRQEIARRARPFMLRRWKRDVLQDLPDKVESVKLGELSSEQKKLYAAYLAKLQQETLKHLSVNGYQKSRIKILAGLTRLRQICCHPALFVEGYHGGSAKLEQLMEIVEECLANRKRMLIFSQFTGMLSLIGRTLHDAGLRYFYLDGSTPARERVELCDRFNDGEMDIFLISTKAGGTGLNLTGADTVILYDLWWNPAVEQQAADRAHRIGQKQTVHVIRLISQGTMEEKMYELQHRKKQLIDEVLGTGKEPSDEMSMLTEQELRDILMI